MGDSWQAGLRRTGGADAADAAGLGDRAGGVRGGTRKAARIAQTIQQARALQAHRREKAARSFTAFVALALGFILVKSGRTA